MIKLASFNIRAGMGMDGIFNIERVTKKITSIPADFIALQEVDNGLSRSQRLDEAKIFAEATNMHYEFAKAIDFDGGEYGVALFSKVKPVATKKIPLPGSEEKRVLLICEFENVVVCCTHFSLTEDDRIKSIEILKSELCGKYNKPTFVMGDLNSTPDSKVVELLQQSFDVVSDATTYTFPANAPKICIDYILMVKNPSIKADLAEKYVDNDVEASDHLYISSTIEEK
ncbi:MAG: endonuclease/exonuclease/phosphatase family protein [Kiritimatiellae bacterium]|nr:endonuclease/exonuclease/phosphatase family protein [Kiritimatiellia bacterium]